MAKKLNESTLINAYLRECGRLEPLWPEQKSTPVWSLGQWTGNGNPGNGMISLTEDGTLVYNLNQDEIELARYVGRRTHDNSQGVLLLNGDGLESRILQTLQTRLRERARRIFGIRHSLIVPYMALEAAQVDLNTIKSVAVLGDRWESVKTYVKNPRTIFDPENPNPAQRLELDSIGRCQIGSNLRYFDRTGGRPARFEILHQALNNRQMWHVIGFTKNEAWITSNVHRLGSAVFTGESLGQEHTYVSSFDEQEQTPLYFLAQLPDDTKPKTFPEAVNALAPPIVHAARKEGRDVRRQGDVFAVETNLTDKDMKDCAVGIRSRIFGGTGSKRVIEKEHREQGLDRAIMIYGTGHTATRVAKKPNGVTFIKGSLYHDPSLETDGRTREHRNVTLYKDKWYLAVRNTVPRQQQ